MKMVKLNGQVVEVSQHTPSNTYDVNGELVQAEPLSLQDYESLVLEWSDKRGLLKLENEKKACEKLIEEVGELAGAMLKNNTEQILLEMGDVMVTCINLANISKFSFAKCFRAPLRFENDSLPVLYHRILKFSLTNEPSSAKVATNAIQELCTRLNITALDCLAAAYAKIKDRTGRTENGTFIKD